LVAASLLQELRDPAFRPLKLTAIRESGNPVSQVFAVKSINKELDPRLRGGDENSNPAINKFNYLHSYLSTYGDKSHPYRGHPPEILS
jgi:hypothetical protein